MIKLTLTNFNSVLYCTNWLPGTFDNRLIRVICGQNIGRNRFSVLCLNILLTKKINGF